MVRFRNLIVFNPPGISFCTGENCPCCKEGVRKYDHIREFANNVSQTLLAKTRNIINQYGRKPLGASFVCEQCLT